MSGHGPAVEAGPWADAREALRERGLRWTPQRRLILEVLAETSGHITGADAANSVAKIGLEHLRIGL